MRGSGWILPIIATALWLGVILWPLAASFGVIINQPRSDAGAIEIRRTAELLLVSGGWGLAVALAAMAIGWAPGRWLGSAIGHRPSAIRRRTTDNRQRAADGRQPIADSGFIPLAVLMLVPICLPAYVVFYAWWSFWPADTAIFRWTVEHGQVQNARYATLLVGFVCWSWPIVAWCVAGSAAAVSAEREEMLQLDGAGLITRTVDRLRRDFRGLLVGGLIAFLATFNNTVCFDLAQVFTFGNELRAIEAMGATHRDVLSAAMPATLLTMLGAIAIWFLLGCTPIALRKPQRHRDTEGSESEMRHCGDGTTGPEVRSFRSYSRQFSAVAPWLCGLFSQHLATSDSPIATRSPRAHGGTIVFTVIIWLASVAIPLGLLARHFTTGPFAGDFRAQLDQFWRFYSRGLLNTLGVALVSAALAMVIAIGLAWMWQDRRAWVRLLAHGQAAGWIIAAAVPGTLYGVALSAAYNRGMLAEAIYLQPAILVIGSLGRFAFIGALLGRWLAMREPRSMRELRALDGAERFTSLIRTTWPRMLAAGGATFCIVLVLSLSEIPVTALVRPPGFDLITPSILNDMHFQRPQTVMIATGVFLVLALVAACVAVCAWWVVARMGRNVARAMPPAAAGALLFLVLVAPGCGAVDPENAPPLDSQLIFGSAGRGPGQFNYPRAMSIDWENEFIYIVDRSSRIQRFSLDGEAQLSWTLPNADMGFPTGLTVGPNGLLYVADTHYFRVLVFDHEGNEVMRFGEFGTEPGQFIYPIDIAIGPQGRIYVSETGGNDRVQVFDDEGNYLFHFGSFGSGPDQFNRPQSLMFNREMTELFIADACNHRVVVTDPDGAMLRTIGGPGRALGEFSYPYGVHVYDDDSLLVTEFHNCRIQKFAPDGSPRGVWGRVGFRKGELQFPWALAGNDHITYVLDSGNNRVQMIRTP